MTEKEIRDYCAANGVPISTVKVKGKDHLRVLDLTQLSQTIREHFDDQGMFSPQSSPVVIEPQAEEVSHARHTGQLQDGFPGKAALEEAGHNTYAKVRKLRDQDKLLDVPGIGEATASHIQEALREA
jgi:hypothetical protein